MKNQCSFRGKKGTPYELDRLLVVPLVESRDVSGESKVVGSKVDEGSIGN